MTLSHLDIDQIRPNPHQPRVHFQPEKLAELAASVKEKGILQPIVVRPTDQGYEIVAGERRWRAAQQAGHQKIPCIVQHVDDQEMLEIALVENVQRDDLSPIEEAHAYRLMLTEFQLTQEEISRRVGRSRSAVANTLRLLHLPVEVQALVSQGDLSMGHARALLPLSKRDQLSLSQTACRLGLSVRSVERRVQNLLKRRSQPIREPARDPNVVAAERRLEQRWKTKVEIRPRGRQAGQIVLHYHSAEELDRLFEELLAH
jgi:ParB family chromosome partitioning protein